MVDVQVNLIVRRMTDHQQFSCGTPLNDIPTYDDPCEPNPPTMTMSTTELVQKHVEIIQKEFAWLQCDHSMENLYCQPCSAAGMNIRMDISATKSLMQEHAMTDSHLAAVRLKSFLGNNVLPHSEPPGLTTGDQLSNVTKYPSMDANSSDNYEELCDEVKIKEELEESDNEIAEIVDNTEENIATWPSLGDDTEEETISESPKDTRVRRFCDHWLLKFPWLQFDRERNLMFCKLCLKYCTNSNHTNTFMKGNSCFKIVSLSAHAGSLDHQMAERADELDKPLADDSSDIKQRTISARQKFLVKKYLGLFPWLLYRADLQRLICELCDRHTRNSLYIDATDDIDYQILDHHRKMRLHAIAEETEVKSWSIAWEGLAQFGASQCAVGDVNTRQDDCQRRWMPLFRDTSVSVVGSEKELSAAEDASKINNQETEVDIVERNKDVSSENVTSELNKQATGVMHTNWSSHHRYYVRKKPPILPAFGVFQSKWLTEFPWLRYDSQQNIMKCSLCEKYKKSLGFARGVRVFSRSYIVGHMSMKKHREALMADGYTVPDYPRERKRRKKSQKQATMKMESYRTETSFSEEGTISEEQWTDQSSLPESNPCPLVMTVSTALSNMITQSTPSSSALANLVTQYTPSSTEKKPEEETFYKDQSPTRESNGSSSKRRKRCFFPNWANQFPWVEYRQEGHYMLCTWCVQHGFASAFTRGCKTFHIDSLRSHDGSVSHQHAAQLELARPNC